MKCELCHNADAEVAITRTVAGEEQELYVCHACAQETAGKEAGDQTQHQPAQEDAKKESSTDLAAWPLMGMILDAAFEIIGRETASVEPRCPVCGITRSEYRKASRLGCPACYESFAKELDAAILEMHRAQKHIGKIPERAQSVCRQRELEKALGEAVKNQRYEEAITLRDQLRRLGGTGTSGGGAA